MHKISTRHMFQEKFGGISRLLLWFEATTSTQDGPTQDISSQEYQLFFTSSSRIISPTIHTFIYFASLFGLKDPNKRRRFKTYSYVVKGFSDIPPASTLGKVYAHYNSTNDLTSRSNILVSIGNTSFS